MEKKTFSLFLVEPVFKDFQKKCKAELTTPSREFNLYMMQKLKGGQNADKTV